MTESAELQTYYFDTNALWKYYQDQPGALNVRRLVSSPHALILVSPLTLVEFIGVLMKYYRKRLIKRKDVHAITKRLRRDIGVGNSRRPFKLVALPEDVFHEGQSILLEHGSIFDIQTNDALHLAVVVTLNSAQSSRVILVTCDNSLHHASEKKFVPWYDPEQDKIVSPL
jgi:predicted nucleic acid-binding protein